MSELLQQWSTARRATIDAHLGSLFSDTWPQSFGEMCRYPLLTGGKRMRPLLVLAAYEALAGSEELAPAMGPALSIELVHTYSLVHDDLPCMDDDDLRRGKPTVHSAFGEGSAVLVGDALLTEAFALVASSETLNAETRLAILGEISGAAGHLGMIGGQAVDLGLGPKVDNADVLTRMHRAKTGALIRASCRMGALAAGASPDQLAGLTRYGEAVGLAFQLADDLLDLDQDAGPDGPPAFPKLIGVEATQHRAAELHQEAIESLSFLGDRRAILEGLSVYTVERSE